jgi:serine/threonine protein kinase
MDRSTFFQLLRRSRLLSDEEVNQLDARVPGEQATAVATVLVAQGKLTQYQAQELLRGNAVGFVLRSYRILERLGRGGTGSVFKAVHTGMRRVVALKIVKPKKAGDEAELHLFQREVRATAQLDHPNIVRVYDADQARGVYFLVTEFVDGPDLERLVRLRGPLPVGLACDLIRQAATGLQYAHDRGMVHRDIKPANLLVANAPGWKSSSHPGDALPVTSPVPLVKILDFGLARYRQPQGDASTIAVRLDNVAGTPDYVSPEQAQNIHAADIRSDLYSLGCTFYFALTGRVPFPGQTAMEKYVKHLTEEPEPLRRLRPDVPAPVAAIVRRLMAKAPAERFQMPAELAAALRPWCRLDERWPIAAETRPGPTLNTPAGNEPEAGTGWVFELPPSLGRNRVLTQQSPGEPRWSLWLALGLSAGAFFGVLLVLILSKL